MNQMTRTRFLGVVSGLFGAALFGKEANAQYGQAAGNDAQIVSTGNVHLGQEVAASQSVIVRDGHGNIVRGAGQTVFNDGQIVATGDVFLDQSASASQDIYEGGSSGQCVPGTVVADPYDGQLYYYDAQCACRPVVIECRRSCR